MMSPDDQIARLLRLAASSGLAGVERGTSYGTPSIKVSGKFLARLFDSETLAIRCPIEEKEVLMQAEPGIYFETAHYKGYDAMLIRLRVIDDSSLSARLESAWRMQASKRAVASRDAQQRKP